MTVKFDIKNLTTAERLALIEQLWDSFSPSDLPTTEAQKAELDRRIDDVDAHPEASIPWDDVVHRLRKVSE